MKLVTIRKKNVGEKENYSYFSDCEPFKTNMATTCWGEKVHVVLTKCVTERPLQLLH